ncbi:SDR family NAD(P)-dependent oxidoreductase [Staphylococcus aureus]|uniref:SDR family NAD(P)-dependent oxidoreductase n=1 Tax=Staphylococcus aureus TaxID=1280 RepID=UPI00118C7E14|nr:glucose 1-dehydrogenase [Staphylococcus aureus]QDS48312.1 glucose 1-dehydrogenase [Staphylococcus aureus]
MESLENKVIIITGAAQGMGQSHAKKCIEEGAYVVVTDLNREAGQKTAEELGDNALFIAHDVTNEDDWNRVVDTVMDKWGRIDVLVNNAGITFHTPLEDLDLASYMKIVNINQVSVFLGMKAVAKPMKQQKNGDIINISSINGIVGGAIGYTDTKFAVRGMTKAAAKELSPHNIRVNSIHPGVIQTPMLEQEGVKQQVEEFVKTIPIRRTAEAEEVSNMIVFLASDVSSYATGSEFILDGGVTAL